MSFFDGFADVPPNAAVSGALRLSPSADAASSSGPTFDEIYRENRSYLWRTLRRLGVPERHLEDVAHEALLVVHRKLPEFRPDRPLKPWLFGIAFRVASEFRRAPKNARETPHDEIDCAHPQPLPDEEAEARQLRRSFYQAMETLTDAKRAVFVLHDIDGESMPDVAAALSIPLNTAYSRLRHARRELSVRLKARYRRSDGDGT